MATAIEYGIIAGGISLAIIAVVNGLPAHSSWTGNYEKQQAAKACEARPAGSTQNVFIHTWVGGKQEYSCPYFSSISYPTLVTSQSSKK